MSSTARFYPADELIGRETNRNKDAILYLIERAGCRYDVLGKSRTHCGPLFDDFEIATRLDGQPVRDRHRDRGRVAARGSVDHVQAAGDDDRRARRRS